MAVIHSADDPLLFDYAIEYGFAPPVFLIITQFGLWASLSTEYWQPSPCARGCQPTASCGEISMLSRGYVCELRITLPNIAWLNKDCAAYTQWCG